MSRWPIHRRWTIVGAESPREVISERLTDFGGLCLIGAAGLGKTFELEYLVEQERQAGREVRKVRAAELAHSAEALAHGLDQLASMPTAATAIYIDALDEAMVPVRHAGLVVAAWLRNRIRGSGISVRLACRSAVFPDTIRAALLDVYGDSLSIAALQPLTLDDVATVTEHVGANREQFIRLVERSRIESLATQPLTLSMLLQISRSGRQLPATRAALFEEGVRLLATERSERIEDGTAVDIPVADLLDAAERVSCFTLLAGVELVDYGDLRFDGMLTVHELGGLAGGTRPLDTTMLRALRQSGLSERGGPTAFRMAHRQIAEYLAGRRLARLLPHQAKALLASPIGADFGVAGPLRETAAFVATLSEPIAAWISERDPEVIGMSDVADQALRRRAMLNVLQSLRRHELTDSQLWRGAFQVEGLRYDGAENDLRPILRERTDDSSDVLQGALWFIDQWKLASLGDELAEITLDVAAPREARKSAGYALQGFGTVAARSRLLPLIHGGSDDPDDDLKGIALSCNYPDRIDSRLLLDVLTRPQRSNYGGAYFAFLHRLSRQGLDVEDCLVEALMWARQFFSAHEFDSDPLVRIAKRMCRTATAHLDDPAVAGALAQTLVHAAP